MKTSVSLADKKCFDLFIGERVLKSQVFGNKAGIPVYSANVFTPFGFVKKSNISDFSKYYILWGIDGDFFFNIISPGAPFATTDHCGAIEVISELIHPEYVLFQLRMKSHELGFGRAVRASLNNMKMVSIEIPVKSNGEFDLELQKKIAAKYEKLELIKKGLREEKEAIEKIKVYIPFNGRSKSVSLGDKAIFFVDNGERITKTDIEKSPGSIPVYSGSKIKDETMGFVSDAVKTLVPNAKKFSGKCLTVNANGSVGRVFLRNEEFYLHDDVNIVQILNENISYEYLLYELQNKINLLGYGAWTKKLYKTELKEVVSVDIPIKSNGEFDLEMQKKIAAKYEKIDETNDKILKNILPLIETDIAF